MTSEENRQEKRLKAMKRITISQIAKIVDEYLGGFPGWRKLDRDGIYRATGPLVQAVLFERLSFGVYRPIAFLHSMLRPFDDWGAQFQIPILNPKGSDFSISLREHCDKEDRYKPKLLAALRTQLQPPPHERLELSDVYEVCIRLSDHDDPRGICHGPTAKEALALAALAAYLERDQEAAQWISTYHKQLQISYRDDKREQADAAYLSKLELWMKEGVARKRLAEISNTVKTAHRIEETE